VLVVAAPKPLHEPPSAMQAALRGLKLERRKPNDVDRPRPSTFPGPKAKALPGQLDLFGGEVAGVEELEP
jgi:hypothetical protein